nr:retrovirus-related Pol polyprotein from transposon TNT 1-94 [Tanacetum cinerariifolium]
MYKLDLVTLAPKDKNNRKTHIYYLKHTMEQVVILREIVKQSKSLNPLESASYSACKYAKLIQELLGYVRDTCPDIHKPSKKLVAIMPINKKKTVRTTATIKVPLRELIPLEVVEQEYVVTKVYTRRSKVVQIILWYLDSGCSKHMTRDRSQLTNFVYKFLGTVKFGNDQIAKIMSLGHGHQCMIPATSSSGLVSNPILQQPFAVALRPVDLADSLVSTLIDQDASSTRISSIQKQEHSLIISQGFEESSKTPHLHEFLYEDSTSQGSSSNMRTIHTPFKSLGR